MNRKLEARPGKHERGKCARCRTNALARNRARERNRRQHNRKWGR